MVCRQKKPQIGQVLFYVNDKPQMRKFRLYLEQLSKPHRGPDCQFNHTPTVTSVTAVTPDLLLIISHVCGSCVFIFNRHVIIFEHWAVARVHVHGGLL